MSDIEKYLKARPLSEYHEDMGPVLWWCLTETGVTGNGKLLHIDRKWLGEPPYCGTPNDLGFEIAVEAHLLAPGGGGTQCEIVADGKTYVGGWPGYHTHWTPIMLPVTP